MRVSWQWLAEYVDLPSDPDQQRELRRRLEMSGLAIDVVDRPGQGADGIWAGRVLTVDTHPSAAELWVVKLDLGPQGSRTVVSGASNFSVGDMVPVVVPGGSMPGGKPIGSTEIRGVVSDGMMCSPGELGVGDGEAAAAGIMILPRDTAPGTDCLRLLDLDDQVLELDLTPNYAVFCQSMLGVAREVAALTGGAVRVPASATVAGPLAAASGPMSAVVAGTLVVGQAAAIAGVDIQAPDLCGRYSGALFSDVHIEPSPWWMQRRLLAAGQRPINNIVDVTNYVMLELGQPLHAFDLDLVRDGKVIVRRAIAGERLRTLDGVDRELPPDALVIADQERGIAIAGVMGGENSEIGPHTTRVFLESANFLRTSVRRTSRRLGLRTEASSRFEKGLDPAITVLAIERVSQLWTQLGAARRIDGLIDVVAQPAPPREIVASTDYLRTVTGMDLPASEMVDLLSRIGIPSDISSAGAQGEAETLRAMVPTRRLDVEGPADLAEEIARVYGYDRIEAKLPLGVTPSASLPPRRSAALAARSILLGCGLDELVTFAYHAPAELDRLGLAPDHPWRQAIPVLNPMTEEQGVMRTSLVPNLLRVAAHNTGHGVDQMHGFEIGRVYLASSLPLTKLPQEPLRCGVLLAGAAPGTVNWRDKGRAADFYTLKGILESLLTAMRVPLTQFSSFSAPYLHPGRAAQVHSGEALLGWLGELHPRVAADYDLRQRVYLAELDFELLMHLRAPQPLFGGLPRYPALERDLAFVVPQGLPAGEVEAVIRQHGGALLEQVRLFDVYEGSQVTAGHRSLAYALRLRANDRTLTDQEADELCRSISAALSALGVQLRA